MCGCLRVAFSRPAVPLSVTEILAASAFAASVKTWAAFEAAEGKQPLESTLVEVMTRCTVSLPALLPKVTFLWYAEIGATAVEQADSVAMGQNVEQVMSSHTCTPMIQPAGENATGASQTDQDKNFQS